MKYLYILTLLFSSIVFSQEINLKEIMKGEEFIGYQPRYPFWSHDSKTIIFDWKKETDFDFVSYQYQAGKVSKIPFDLYSSNMMEGYKSNGTKGLFTSSGRLFLFDIVTGEKKQLFYSNNLREAYFTVDDDLILIQVASEFFKFNLKSAEMTKLIEFGKFPEKEEPKVNFLNSQQEELFEIVRFRKKSAAFDKKRGEEIANRKYAEINVEEGYWLNVAISGDLKNVAYVRSVDPKAKDTDFFQFITENGEGSAEGARPKVGRADADNHLHIYNLNLKEGIVFDPEILSDVRKRPLYLKEYEKENFKEESESAKAVVYHNLAFSEDGKKLLFEVKSFDNKDRWLVVYDFDSKTYKEINHQHDEAWIGGPGIIGWTTAPGNIGWFLDSDRIYFQSEESGYSHLYIYSLKSGKTEQLTKGNFEIHEAILSRDNTKFYITANKSNAGNRDFLHLEVKTGKWTTILAAEGNFEVSISPNEEKLAYRYSNKNTPWELFVTDNFSKAKFIQITNSTTPAFQKIAWISPEIIHFKASDGVEVPARLYQPEKEKSKGKAVIFVHGAGYLQNAHNWWSAYHREYMFHNLLVSKGYTVLDIDYRASEGYGRDWRTSIYRHMGSKDLSDQVDGRNYLIEELGISEDKVGIYGGSYGGFITLMALLKEPGKFQCGAAIRSVTDWAHYNHPYTSNILNTPETDSIAYVRSSPIYFAENLEDQLLILHGMEDDNVQFQDVVRLTQRFIELEKDKFEMAIYPIEPHGFVQSSSWYDEYKRILKLFEENL